jgi:hypothetical protein
MFAVHFRTPSKKFAIGENFNMIDYILIRYPAFGNTKRENVNKI